MSEKNIRYEKYTSTSKKSLEKKLSTKTKFKNEKKEKPKELMEVQANNIMNFFIIKEGGALTNKELKDIDGFVKQLTPKNFKKTQSHIRNQMKKLSHNEFENLKVRLIKAVKAMNSEAFEAFESFFTSWGQKAGLDIFGFFAGDDKERDLVIGKIKDFKRYQIIEALSPMNGDTNDYKKYIEEIQGIIKEMC